MSKELSEEQQYILGEIRDSMLWKDTPAKRYKQKEFDFLLKDAQKLEIPFPLVVKTIVAATPREQKAQSLFAFFIFNDGLTIEDTIEIADDLGIDGFDPKNWWNNS